MSYHQSPRAAKPGTLIPVTSLFNWPYNRDGYRVPSEAAARAWVKGATDYDAPADWPVGTAVVTAQVVTTMVTTKTVVVEGGPGESRTEKPKEEASYRTEAVVRTEDGFYLAFYKPDI